MSAASDEAALEQAVRRLGWRVYATNHTAEDLRLEQSVAAYRSEYLIEQGFGRLKGRSLSLSPLFLHYEHRIVGLICLLTVALRVLVLMQFVVRRNLAATRHNAYRYLSGAARTPDSAPNHRDDAAHLSWRDAVVHDGQRTIFPPSDTAQRSAAAHPRIAGIASGDLLQDRYSIVKFRVSFTRNVSGKLSGRHIPMGDRRRHSQLLRHDTAPKVNQSGQEDE